MSRPNVVILMSASLDGRTALGPGRSQWEEMDDPRSSMTEGVVEAWSYVESAVDALHRPDAKMLGSASIMKETDAVRALDPAPGDPRFLYQDYLPDRVTRTLGIRVWLITPDSRGRLRSGYEGTETPGHHVLHLVSRSTPAEYLAFLRDRSIPYIVAGGDKVDLPIALERLHAQLDVACLVAIGGGRLNGALLRAGLVDEVNVIVRPELIGGIGTPTLFDCPDLAEDAWPTRLERLAVETVAERFLWLRYGVARPAR